MHHEQQCEGLRLLLYWKILCYPHINSVCACKFCVVSDAEGGDPKPPGGAWKCDEAPMMQPQGAGLYQSVSKQLPAAPAADTSNK